MGWLRAFFVMIVLAPALAAAQAQPNRIALVIGVSDYERDGAAQAAAGFIVPPSLANAVRDAQLVGDALTAQGFQVTRVMDPDKRTMLAAVAAFGAALGRAGPDAVGVLYFAGHGAQGRPALERDVDNYLIPIGADLITEVDLDSEALGLSRVSATVRPGTRGTVVLILDACRNFALQASSRSGMRTRGLVEARASSGTVIAYATAPGDVALDGPPGQNGYYARALAAQVRGAAGTRLEDIFIAVRNDVLAATNGAQTPWENGSLRSRVTLGVAPVVRATGMAAPAPSLERVEGDWVLCWKGDSCLSGFSGTAGGIIRLRLGLDGSAQISDTFTANSGVWRIEGNDVVVQMTDWVLRSALVSGECMTGRVTVGGRVMAGMLSREASRSAPECWAMAETLQ